MGRVKEYRAILRGLDAWEPFLLEHSGLPGPRANLELVQAAADEGDEKRFRRWLALGPDVAPFGSADEFLPVCGVVGMGKLLAQGNAAALDPIRERANDPRWRLREGVAMALQRWGDHDPDALLAEMARWATGSLLEQRAPAAALCEPRLLARPEHVRRVLDLLDRITASLVERTERKGEAFQALRKGLAYCWSVAVAAHPPAGRPAMEKWLAAGDPDVRWIMRQNLKKQRLARMDRDWVQHWAARLEG